MSRKCLLQGECYNNHSQFGITAQKGSEIVGDVPGELTRQFYAALTE